VFSLEGQIQHKVYFISEYLPADVQVMLIGHSIGAYILLETMDRIEKERIIHGMGRVHATVPVLTISSG